MRRKYEREGGGRKYEREGGGMKGGHNSEIHSLLIPKS